MSFSTLNRGTSLTELSAEEMALVSGGAETIVMKCKVENNEFTECEVSTKED